MVAVTSEDEASKRRERGRGYLVTMATVLSLVGGLGLTVLGLGSADQAVASFDAASWVWSRAKGGGPDQWGHGQGGHSGGRAERAGASGSGAHRVSHCPT
jgi:hypothetical protein